MALITSVLTGGVNNHPTTSEEANAWSTDFISEGIVGSYTNTSGVAPATGSLACNAQGTPDMTVAVTAGIIYVQGTPTSQNSQTFRIKLTANQNVTISANSSGSTKYDWIYVKLDATKLNGPSVAGDDAATLVTSRSTSQSSDDGTPPTYGYPIAVVTVANGASSITNENIRDSRANCIVNLGSSSVSSGWTDLGYAPNSVTANGNRSYSLVFNSVDLTGTISNGMRLKLPRTIAPPTQCTSLNGTTQYWNKTTSLTSIAFTDDFVVSAWVKLSSYPTATMIASRYNGTSGWALFINSTGQLRMSGYSGSSANESYVQSYQSIPLNKWVHVSAQLDMSAFTSTVGAEGVRSWVMMDGLEVPSSVSRSGTSPTSLVQAGNLEIGSWNGGLLPFAGKIAQVALYSAKVTQATVRASMNQTLTGSETSLIGAWTFNGNGNDSSSNALDLTAQASATATTTDSPMNATEYGLVHGVSFSTNTTLTVQVPEGETLPTTGGIGTVSYSTQKTPYGFPGSRAKWQLQSILKSSNSSTSNATYGAFISGGFALSVPVGEWSVGWYATLASNTTTEVFFALSSTALTGLTTIQGANISRNIASVLAPTAGYYSYQTRLEQEDSVAAQVSYVMYSLGSTTGAVFDGSARAAAIFAENGYL